MIRDFTPADFDRAVVLLETVRCMTDYRCMQPDWTQIINVMIAKSQRRDGKILVAEHGKELTGILIATAQPMWWVDQAIGPRIASDLTFFSQRYGDGRQMLRAMVEWAFSVPRVVRIECGISGSDAPLPVMRRLYEREGFELQGSFFVRNHPQYQATLAASGEGVVK